MGPGLVVVPGMDWSQIIPESKDWTNDEHAAANAIKELTKTLSDKRKEAKKAAKAAHEADREILDAFKNLRNELENAVDPPNPICLAA